MITLLASIAGFIGSIMPDILKLFHDKYDKQHEIEILKQQIRIREKGLSGRLDEIATISDLSESKALYSTYKTGIKWVDALNGTVRPVLAYSFFALYSYAKYLQFEIINKTNDILTDITILWGAEDQAIFAGIISFYYGQRAIAKLRSRN